jgi:hypothetical protein
MHVHVCVCVFMLIICVNVYIYLHMYTCTCIYVLYIHIYMHILTYTCIQVVDSGMMVLERNTIYDSCTGSTFHLGSTNSDDDVYPAVRQVVAGEPGEEFARRMAQGFFQGRAVDEVNAIYIRTYTHTHTHTHTHKKKKKKI